jgi:hypothetical protein
VSECVHICDFFLSSLHLSGRVCTQKQHGHTHPSTKSHLLATHGSAGPRACWACIKVLLLTSRGARRLLFFKSAFPLPFAPGSISSFVLSWSHSLGLSFRVTLFPDCIQGHASHVPDFSRLREHTRAAGLEEFLASMMMMMMMSMCVCVCVCVCVCLCVCACVCACVIVSLRLRTVGLLGFGIVCRCTLVTASVEREWLGFVSNNLFPRHETETALKTTYDAGIVDPGRSTHKN